MSEQKELIERVKSQFCEVVDEGVRVTLSKPIEFDGAATSVVLMREPTAGEIELSQRQKDDGKREVELFANLCMLTPDDVRKLRLRDYVRLQVAYSLFTD